MDAIVAGPAEQACGYTIDRALDGTIDVAGTFTLDARGLPLLLEEDDGNDGTVDKATTFEWDADERMTRRTSGPPGVPDSIFRIDEIWRYDATGRLVFQTILDDFPYKSTFFEYDAGGFLAREIMVYAERYEDPPVEVQPAEGEWSEELRYFYTGDLVTRTELRWEPDLVYKTDDYSYDEARLAKIVTRSEGAIVAEATYDRDASGRTTRLTYDAANSSTTVEPMYTATWTYGPEGRDASARVEWWIIWTPSIAEETYAWAGDRLESFDYRATPADDDYRQDNVFACETARRLDGLLTARPQPARTLDVRELPRGFGVEALRSGRGGARAR